ncbi:MAG: DNA repair and recombination protein RadB [Candidatus Hydrothermarchaeales archaeon]
MNTIKGGFSIPKPYKLKDDATKIPIGCGIDNMLEGGVETKIITQIYGPAGSGKTNICLQSALSCIKSGKKVLFIDTEGGHSLDRVKQIAGDRFKDFLENSYFFEPTSFKDQTACVDSLNKVINGEFGLIVLDSAVSLYRIGTDEEKTSRMNRELSHQLAKLSEVARRYNLTVLITNQVYPSFENDGVEPIGGSILQYWSKAIIELKKVGNKREAILKRHRSLPENINTMFIITNEGLKDAK